MTDIIDTFFAVDFDRCLGNFEANVNLLNKVASELTPINGEMIQLAHDEIKANGMPFRILKYFEDQAPDLDLDVLQNTYIERAHATPGILVEPGATELINFLQLGNHHFCIMTYGEMKWQTTKITAAGLGDVSRLIVSHEQKSRHIAEWLDEELGLFTIPSKCFLDGKSRIAREVVLIDDKPNAFTGLPVGARGYLVHNSKSIYSTYSDDLPLSVKRVSCLIEIIEHES